MLSRNRRGGFLGLFDQPLERDVYAKPGTLVVDLPRDLLSPPRSDQMLCWGRLNPFPQGRSLL